ncbi:ubiquinone biosynthesis protein [Naumannella cuiyingiana]|uniref:Ubiquinone biosynthesis protein n=1 Tax=Naumannella cuiyingiana TaxID=1347891 RepID=A0A7Z0IKS6_9ACTN|nr:ubiquinone biosynthesis protein [Naumannella cuiyingiana]
MLENIVAGIFALITWLLAAWLVAGLSRRVLGSRIGWGRTVLMALILLAAVAPVITWLGPTTGVFDYDGPRVEPGVAVVTMVLALAWMFGIGIAFLVVSEVVVPTGSVPGPLEALRGWRQRWRTAGRMRQLGAIAVRNGLGGFLRGRTPDQPASRVAAALTRSLEQAGVTFVKVGQLASTRPDLIGPDFAGALSVLQARVAPEPWPRVREVLTASIGGPDGSAAEAAFASIEPEPLAAASVAQVHAARLTDGREVVIKIQRPAARRQVENDLEVLHQLTGWLERNTTWGRELGVRALGDGFARSLNEELDYRIEQANMTAIRAKLPSDSVIRIPRVHPELSGGAVLVMDRIDGVPIGAAREQLAKWSPQRRAELASALLHEVLRQVLVEGTFHADLHPGNIVLSPDGTAGLLDFGSVGRLDRGSRQALAMLLAAVERGDAIGATDTLIDLLGRPPGLDERALERDLGETIARLGAGSVDGLFADLFALLRRHRYRVPTQIAAAFRALMTLEGTLRLIDPGFEMITAARAQAPALTGELGGPAAVRETLEQQLLGMLPALQRLPRRVDKITEQLADGRFTARVSVLAQPEDRRFLTGLVHQLVLGILAAALTIASVVLITTPGGPALAPGIGALPLLGYAVLFVAFVLGLRVLVIIFRHGAD